MNLLKRFFFVILISLSTLSLNSCQCSENFGLNVDPDFKYISDIALYVLSETSTNQDVKMAINFVNEAEKSCCNKSESTNQQNFKVNVYYNANNPNPSNWGTPTESGSKDKKALSPCEQDNGEVETSFLKNGYYLVEMILDFLDNTKERSENNNNSIKKKSGSTITNTFDENAKYGNNRIYKIIHITGLNDANVTKTCTITQIQ